MKIKAGRKSSALAGPVLEWRNISNIFWQQRVTQSNLSGGDFLEFISIISERQKSLQISNKDYGQIIFYTLTFDMLISMYRLKYLAIIYVDISCVDKVGFELILSNNFFS